MLCQDRFTAIGANMTNSKHSAKVSEVWKHMALVEAVTRLQPRRYAETNAGSPSYPIVDDGERSFGVRGFMRRAVDDPVLRSTRYFSRLQQQPHTDSYRGSPSWVIHELGLGCRYLLCDIDQESLDELGAFVDAEGWRGVVEIVDGDGMATVARAVRQDPRDWFVFIDPFDHRASIDNGPNAIDLAVQLLNSGVRFACWYGYNEPTQRFWLPKLLGERTDVELWAGDILTVDENGAVDTGGHLGDATTPGTGSGMAFGNVTVELTAALQALGEHLEAIYTITPLPSGLPGGLKFDTLTC